MRFVISLAGLLMLAPSAAGDFAAENLVRKAMDHWRGQTSYSEMRMIIHRPDWERSMTIRAWSEGDDRTLVRVVEPPKDAGNGTLLIDDNMWTFSPRINRIIKIPSSLMAQSWMGSDFSNKDISKSTAIVDEYSHELSSTDERDGHRYYTVTSVPHEHAAVVWGKEVLTIRDDFVLIRHEFWDQDGELVKVMNTREIEIMDDRPVAKIMRMGEIGKAEHWTQLEAITVDFNLHLPESLFTLSNLRNPRQ